MLLRLLDLGRRTGHRWHFFASERALRAFPAQAEAVLNDGHDLDYLAKHPRDSARFEEARRLFAISGHHAVGWAFRESWPRDAPVPAGIDFLSGPTCEKTPIHLFPVVGRTLRDTARTGGGMRTWLDETKELLNRELTAVVSPQVLARLDPRLEGVEELILAARVAGASIRTLREVLTPDSWRQTR